MKSCSQETISINELIKIVRILQDFSIHTFLFVLTYGVLCCYYATKINAKLQRSYKAPILFCLLIDKYVMVEINCDEVIEINVNLI